MTGSLPGRRAPGPAGRAWRSLAATLVVGALALLSGCATIPGNGPVVAGKVVVGDPREGVVQVDADGPVSGADPAAVVSGFLRAAAGFYNDHRVARKFLTPQRRLAWRPDAAVEVYPSKFELKVKESVVRPAAAATPAGKPSPSSSVEPGGTSADVRDRTESAEVTVTTPIDATIDRDGRYQLAPPGQSTTAKFGLVKLGGDWKISALADGILIDRIDFGVTFRPFPVYFGDPTGRFLVPDLHWFPGTQDDSSEPELPTALVRVLLQGPPKWLGGAVVTGAPPNTAMAVAAVVVSEDVATVDLTDQAQTADTRERQLLAAQLQATLGQLRNIGSVQITVRRLTFDVPAGSGGSTGDGDPSAPDGQPMTDPRVDSRPVVIDVKGRLARLDGPNLETVKDVAGLGVDGANRPAVSYDSSSYAVLNADRSKVLLQLPGTKVATVVTSAGLTAPSFDPQSLVWTAPGANAGFVYAAGVDSAIKVSTPWLKGKQAISLRISRDGARAVVAVRYKGNSHLFLTGVQRNADGLPQALTQPVGLVPDLKTVLDAAWVDEDQVVVLGQRTSEKGIGPWVVQIGGAITEGTAVPEAETITAGNGESSLMAGTETGVLARSGALWSKLTTARWPAFPG